MPEENKQLKDDFISLAQSTGSLLEPVSVLPNHHHHSKAEEALMLAMHWLGQAGHYLSVNSPNDRPESRKFKVTIPLDEKIEQIKKYVDGSMAMTRHLLMHIEVSRAQLLFYNALNCAHNELVACSFWLERAARFHRMKRISRNGNLN